MHIIYNCLNLFLSCSCFGFLGSSYTSEIQELSSYIKQNLSNAVLSFQKILTLWSSVCPQIELLVFRVGTLVILLQAYTREASNKRTSSLTSLCNSVSSFNFLLQPPVLADNLKSNPGIKWQYFSSEEGIFTVFPAHKFRCKGSYEHRSR